MNEDGQRQSPPPSSKVTLDSIWKNVTAGNKQKDEFSLAGQLLIAMPDTSDGPFKKTVIYMCAHNSEGAMGLVINREMKKLSLADMLRQLKLEMAPSATPIQVQFGGPVEEERGFILHSADYTRRETLPTNNEISLTATIDVLQDIARGEGPEKRLLALGYAGWGPGQLENEIKRNGWLNVDADNTLVFGAELETKWERAMHKIGIDPAMLMDTQGHA